VKNAGAKYLMLLMQELHLDVVRSNPLLRSHLDAYCAGNEFDFGHFRHNFWKKILSESIYPTVMDKIPTKNYAGNRALLRADVMNPPQFLEKNYEQILYPTVMDKISTKNYVCTYDLRP
jgi:hypothetical protein